MDAAPDETPLGHGWVEIERGPADRRWQETALVLTALGIDHGVGPAATDDGGGVGEVTLHVRPADAGRAARELAEYRAEIDARPSLDDEVMGVGASGFVPAYAVVLAAVHACAGSRALGLRWWDAGSAQAGLVLQGEWWRAVTALTLHADGSHLLNNLVFGSLFGILLAQEIGVGWAWLALVVSGTLGNGVNAVLHPPTHSSIGASTAVFGALGWLMGLQARGAAARRGSRLRRWAPPVAGAVFLGMLGTGGVRTDVLAHVAGAVVGFGLGLATAPGVRRWVPVDGPQWLPAGVVVAVLALAWWRAFAG